MEILTSVGSKLVEFTVEPVLRQARYVLFYKCNLNKLSKDLKDLEAARQRVNHSIEEAKSNGEEIENDVLNWMKEVNQVINKVNMLHNDPNHSKAGCYRWDFPNLIYHRHQLSRRATKISLDVTQKLQSGKFDCRVGYNPRHQEDVVSFSSPSPKDVLLASRRSFLNNILEALKDPSSHIIGVYGLSGVGKTYLLEEVDRFAQQLKLFNLVVLAKTSNIENIQEVIAEGLGLKFDMQSIDARAIRLKKKMKGKENILIILDDICGTLDLQKVGIPFSMTDSHTGNHNKKPTNFKLMMSSKSKENLLKMGAPENFTFRLEPLDDTESIDLFQFMVGDVVRDHRIKSLAPQLALKCAGLPLAITTVARALVNKDINYWENAVRQLEDVGPEEIGALVYIPLELSYNSLECDEARTLLLLIAVLGFQKVESYLEVVMGLGVLKKIETVRDGRHRLHVLVGYLKTSCLLRESGKCEIIEMHNMVREVALNIASKDKHVFVKRPFSNDSMRNCTNDSFRNCSQIILNCDITLLPQRLDCPNLELLVLSNSKFLLEIPDNFFEGMVKLKVLHLTKFNLCQLPSSLCCLSDLRSLSLFLCVLENMEGIGALTNLQFLNFFGSSLISLPSQIGELIHLKTLDCNQTGLQEIPPNILSCLTELEELKCRNFIIWESNGTASEMESPDLRQLSNLAELRQLSKLTTLELMVGTDDFPLDLQWMFKKLERFKIHFCYHLMEFYSETLNTLHICCTNAHIEELMKRAEALFLNHSSSMALENVNQLNSDGFPLLEVLRIRFDSSLKRIVDTHLGQIFFPNLEKLEIFGLSMLEEICRGPVAPNSFRKLTTIEVINCFKLKHLLSPSLIKELSQLVKIHVSGCGSLEGIVFLNDNYASVDNEIIEFVSLKTLELDHLHKLDNFCYYNSGSSEITEYQGLEPLSSALFNSSQVAFPNLHSLTLSKLDVENFWDDNQHITMFNLKTLIVRDCENIKYLFLSTMVGSFKNLRQLEIKNCRSMEEIIAKEKANSDVTALEECGSLEHVLPLSVVTSCSKLNSLCISDCKEIVAVIENEDSVFIPPQFELNALKTLSFKALPQLKGFYGGNHTLACPSLRVMTVLGCAKLTVFKTQESLMLLQEPLFVVEEVIPHLERLDIMIKDANLMISQTENIGSLVTNLKHIGLYRSENEEEAFPRELLQSACSLESCSFEKIFLDDRLLNEEIRLKSLKLSHLPKIYEGPHLLLEFIGHLAVEYCPSLTNLIPSCASFNSLISLEITNCNGLISLITSSMGEILGKLEVMKVKGCNSLEAIITAEENLDFGLLNLEVLVLESLPKLNKFSSCKSRIYLPLLVEVEVNECPLLEIFSEGMPSTPNLLDIKRGELYYPLAGNLNDSIRSIFISEEICRSDEHHVRSDEQ
ncbi:probable disease resistance protein At4g27220 [Medicago truncatula]|uniref:probable disease resistance protein At4g27220 n=1 Tax=Medicago truncatula TaxID=3880 RepID=UPI00196702A7|nr:probable disease resistance protein At4g27220 [Medicago truncatula]